MPLQDVTLDHVAVAVQDLAPALLHWHGLHAVEVAGGGTEVFRTEQVRLGNGAKVELIAPGEGAAASFVQGFLDRFGAGRIHHVTLKVPGPLLEAAAHLRDAGLDVVDIRTELPFWHEGFLRPSQVGGLIVQVAWSDGTDEDFARRVGRPAPAPPDPRAPSLSAVRLGHPDLRAAADLWRLLGGDVCWGDDRTTVEVSFSGSPMGVQVVQAASPGPLGLIVDGVGAEAGPFSPRMMPEAGADAA